MEQSKFNWIRYGTSCFKLPGWRLFKVTGSDRVPFFQGQTTNDLQKISFNNSQLSARLNRQGRIQGYFYLAQKKEHLFLLILDEMSSVLEDFKKFIIAEDVVIRELKVNLQGILGALSSSLIKEFKTEEYFHLRYHGEDALVYWGENQDVFNLERIDKDDLEILRFLNGWPKWKLNVFPQMLINETCLDRLAVSYNKGCFLGQETVAKIHSRKGAAKHMALMEAENILTDPSGKSFLIEEKKAGTVHTLCHYQDKTYLETSLARPFMITGRSYLLEFEDQKIQAKVCSYPFFKDQNNTQKAITLYDRAISFFKDSQDKKAIENLNHAIKINPLYADAYEALGVIHGRKKEYHKAVDLMDRVLQMKPDSVMAHANKSLYYMNLGKIEEAEEEKKLATINSFKQEGAKHKAKQAQKLVQQNHQKEIKRREEMFKQVLELDENDPIANYGLGDIALEQGKEKIAVTYLKKVINIDEKHQKAYLSLGKALESLNKKEEAKDVYEKGIKMASKKGDLLSATKMQSRLDEMMFS